MKKIKRVLLCAICVYIILCQINIITKAYFNDELVNILNFKTVNDDGEPEKYDIEIDAKDLKEDVEFPVIQASLDYILYGNDEFSNIDFLGLNDSFSGGIKYQDLTEMTNRHTAWLNLSNLGKSFLRVSIYIGTASLLVLLVYFAIVIVKGSISDNGMQLPGEKSNKKIFSLGDNISTKKAQRDKLIIQEWIKSVALMTLIIVVINLVVGFSNMISSEFVINENGDMFNPITIYVKADKNSQNSGIPDLPEDLENLQAKDLFSYGNIAFQHTDQPEGQEAMEYIFNTIGSLVNIAHAKYPMKKSLVIAQVVLESGWVSKYYDSNHIKSEHNNIIGINAYPELTSEDTTWYKKGHNTVIISMPHDEGSTHSDEPVKHYDNLYECVEDYMGQFIAHHPEDRFGDYNDITNYEKYIHGYTPTKDAGQDMYIYYRDRIKKYNLERFDNMPDTPVGTKGALSACYFNTSLEGLYMFESQFEWKDNVLHNLMYIVCGLLITIIKWVLFIVFLIRLALVFALIIFAPIIIIINTIKSINGNDGLLRKWFVLYVYIVLLKPILGVLYSVITRLNTKTVADNPFYILIAIAVIGGSIIFSSKKVIVYIKKN